VSTGGRPFIVCTEAVVHPVPVAELNYDVVGESTLGSLVLAGVWSAQVVRKNEARCVGSCGPRSQRALQALPGQRFQCHPRDQR